MAFPKGKKHFNESKARMSASKRGCKASDAARESMRLAQRKRANDRAELVRETIQTIAEVKKVLADAKAEDAQAVAK